MSVCEVNYGNSAKRLNKLKKFAPSEFASVFVRVMWFFFAKNTHVVILWFFQDLDDKVRDDDDEKEKKLTVVSSSVG